MHAVVEPAELCQVEKLPRRYSTRATFEGIKNAILDVPVLSECQQQFVFVNEERIVDKDSYGDSAIRCLNDMVDYQGPDRIDMP
jgi:hypothetical protein